MGKIFDMDNIVFRTVGKIFDLAILNILFLATCIPIITIGSALTALYATTLKMVENKDRYVIKEYLKAFASNFRQAVILWISMLGGAVILAVDMRFYHGVQSDVAWLLYVITILGVLILTIEITYVFPLLARFENTCKETLKNALLIGLGNLSKTILMIGVEFAMMSFVLTDVKRCLRILPIWVLIGFAGTAYLKSYLFCSIFKKIEMSQLDVLKMQHPLK